MNLVCVYDKVNNHVWFCEVLQDGLFRDISTLATDKRVFYLNGYTDNVVQCVSTQSEFTSDEPKAYPSVYIEYTVHDMPDIQILNSDIWLATKEVKWESLISNGGFSVEMAPALEEFYINSGGNRLRTRRSSLRINSELIQSTGLTCKPAILEVCVDEDTKNMFRYKATKIGHLYKTIGTVIYEGQAITYIHISYDNHIAGFNGTMWIDIESNEMSIKQHHLKDVEELSVMIHDFLSNSRDIVFAVDHETSWAGFEWADYPKPKHIGYVDKDDLNKSGKLKVNLCRILEGVMSAGYEETLKDVKTAIDEIKTSMLEDYAKSLNLEIVEIQTQPI